MWMGRFDLDGIYDCTFADDPSNMVFWVYPHIQDWKHHPGGGNGSKKRGICHAVLVWFRDSFLLELSVLGRMVFAGRADPMVYGAVFLPLVLYNFWCFGKEIERL